MKKLVSTLAISAVAVSAFAQGTINVANNGTTLVSQWASAADHTLSSVAANGGKVQFFAAPDGTAFSALGALVTTGNAQGFALAYASQSLWMAANPSWNAYQIGSVAPIAGRFVAGTATVSPLAAGGKIEYVLAGWTGTSATLDAAITAGASIGQSALYTGVATGNPTTTPIPGTPTALTDTFTGMTLAPQATITPEPSTFALAGLGAAAMLILRRRK
jgi:hypothetical protein